MKRLGTRKIGPVIVTVAAMLSPTWSWATAEQDPWENVNRAIFRFNDTLDTYALKPVAQGYQKITPELVQKGVTNFFNNIGDVANLANNLLQGKVQHAGVDTSRVLFNSTFGVLGVMDVATPMGLQRNNEDFGQTLGVWGVGSGSYVMLPFFGPSTVRDGIGLVPNAYMGPYPYMNNMGVRNGMYALDVVDDRANLLAAEKLITGDRYVFIRNAYLQNREYLIKDGEVVDDF
ncbi:MlaA family lipoprotein [Azomonas agilis]|nr:VacJ family lipoprotein [Azomonas agilis]